MNCDKCGWDHEVGDDFCLAKTPFDLKSEPSPNEAGKKRKQKVDPLICSHGQHPNLCSKCEGHPNLG
jgi:hypothetical protein